jgi:hypothetical protein
MRRRFSPLFVEFPQSPAIGLNLAHVLLLVTLALSFMSGCMAVLLSCKQLAGSEQASGVGARIGMRAGIWAAVVAGGVLILMTTSASYSATTAAFDSLHRGQMWLTLAVGPDYSHVRALARLIEWKGRRAVFIVYTRW